MTVHNADARIGTLLGTLDGGPSVTRTGARGAFDGDGGLDGYAALPPSSLSFSVKIKSGATMISADACSSFTRALTFESPPRGFSEPASMPAFVISELIVSDDSSGGRRGCVLLP